VEPLPLDDRSADPSHWPEDRRRVDPAGPLLTFYDDATGERIELSATTFAQWVAKASGLLRDVVGVQPGDVVAIDLPAHWLGAVLVQACWGIGAVAAPGADPSGAALAVAGPDGLDAALACDEVLAVSLRPLGGRFVDPLPVGVLDLAVEIAAMPDVFSGAPVGSHSPLLEVDGDRQDAAALAALARVRWPAPRRVLTGLGTTTLDGVLTTLVGPLVTGGSVVLCRQAPDADRLAALVEQEGVDEVAG
jgi:uncharacterized protein (TIGR03089 family)